MLTLSSRQPRRHVRRRRATLAVLAALVVVATGGWAYEHHAVTRDARLWPPIGQRIDIGGHRLHLACDGNGTPTVLFETSGFSNSTSYGFARDALTRHTRVCIYDRVGVGWSDPAPRTVTAGMLVDDLRGLQDAASLDGPLIIAPSISRALGVTSCAAISAAAAVGLMRMFDPWNQSESPATARPAALLYGAKPWLELCALVARHLAPNSQQHALDRREPAAAGSRCGDGSPCLHAEFDSRAATVTAATILKLRT